MSHAWLLRGFSHVRATPWTALCWALLSRGSPWKITAVVCHLHLQGLFLTQGSNLGILHCRKSPSLHQDSLSTEPYHLFFFPLSVGGHLDCFHTLATVNTAAINMGVPISFLITVFVFFGYILRCKTAGLNGISVFNFLRNLHIVFYSGCTNVQPTNAAQGFPFLRILTNTQYCLLDSNHYGRWEVISHHGFDLRFPGE